MTYEELLMEADVNGYIVKEKPLLLNDGRIKGNRIAIRNTIPTERQKAEVLLEELEHGNSSCGDIMDQTVPLNRIQELRARRRAYRRQLSFLAIISAYEAGCKNIYEMSEELNISEEFLKEALKWYAGKYGSKLIRCENYFIRFCPNLQVAKILEFHPEKEKEKKESEVVIVRRYSEETLKNGLLKK